MKSCAAIFIGFLAFSFTLFLTIIILILLDVDGFKFVPFIIALFVGYYVSNVLLKTAKTTAKKQSELKQESFNIHLNHIETKPVLRRDNETPYQSLDLMLVGFSHYTNDGIDRQDNIYSLETFDMLVLKREPDNEFDVNAVKVITQLNQKDIGYIKKAHAKQVCALLEETTSYQSYIKKIIFTDKEEFIPVIIIDFFKS